MIKRSKLVKDYISPYKIVDKGGLIENEKKLLNNIVLQPFIGTNDFLIVNGKGYIVLDFKKEIQGGIGISLLKSNSNLYSTIRIRFGESLSECYSELGEGNSTNNHSMRDMVVTLPNLSYQEYGLTGFRFVRIDFLSNEVEYFSSIHAVYIHRDIKFKGTFKSDDPLLNKIFDTAKYTLLLNMQDNLLEGIKRDRLVWVGDMANEALSIDYLFGCDETLEEAITESINHSPLPSWFGRIPSYSMWLIDILYHYLLSSNNVSFVKEKMEYVYGIIAEIDKCITNEGDIDFSKSKAISRDGYFLDWPSRGHKDEKEGNRFLFIYLLNELKELNNLLDINKNDYLDSIIQKLNNHKNEEVSLKQVVALGYLTGNILKEDAKTKLLDGGAKGVSIFLSYYIFKAIKEISGIKKAIEIMEEYFGSILKIGGTTFFENFDIDWICGSSRIDKLPKKNELDFHKDHGDNCYKGYRHSLCHGWSTTPIQFIFSEIVGYKKYDKKSNAIILSPSLGDLKRIKTSLVTPNGVVKLEIINDNNEIIINKLNKTDIKIKLEEKNEKEKHF